MLVAKRVPLLAHVKCSTPALVHGSRQVARSASTSSEPAGDRVAGHRTGTGLLEPPITLVRPDECCAGSRWQEPAGVLRLRHSFSGEDGGFLPRAAQEHDLPVVGTAVRCLIRDWATGTAGWRMWTWKIRDGTAARSTLKVRRTLFGRPVTLGRMKSMNRREKEREDTWILQDRIKLWARTYPTKWGERLYLSGDKQEYFLCNLVPLDTWRNAILLPHQVVVHLGSCHFRNQAGSDVHRRNSIKKS